jgi:hypothetical protein
MVEEWLGVRGRGPGVRAGLGRGYGDSQSPISNLGFQISNAITQTIPDLRPLTTDPC